MVSHATVVLIQDQWGGITGTPVTEQGQLLDPVSVRTPTGFGNPATVIDLEVAGSGAYQLMQTGQILSLGGVPDLNSAASSAASIGSFAIDPAFTGAWLAGGNFISLAGRPRTIPFPPVLHQQRQIVDIDFIQQNEWMLIAFDDGLIVFCSENEVLSQVSMSLQDNDTLRSIAYRDGTLCCLTAQGIIQVWDGLSLDDAPAFRAVNRENPFSPGSAIDIELSPWGDGFYVLDRFGTIHAFGEAPAIPTEPFEIAAATDLEFYPGIEAPDWNPVGTNARIRIQPELIVVDPDGASKRISLVLENVERIWGFEVELHYDPAITRLNHNRIRVGEWWQDVASSPLLRTSVDERRGVCTILGSGSFAMFQSASGGGEIAQLMIASATSTEDMESTLEIRSALLNYAYPDQHRAAGLVQSATVRIERIQPEATLHLQSVTTDQEMIKAGDLFQIDVVVSDGSRLSGLEFGIEFDNTEVRMLGVIPGAGWNQPDQLVPMFSSVSEANAQGGLTSQRITSSEMASLPDEAVAVLTFFFEALEQRTTVLRFPQLQGIDEQGAPMPIEFDSSVQSIEILSPTTGAGTSLQNPR